MTQTTTRPVVQVGRRPFVLLTAFVMAASLVAASAGSAGAAPRSQITQTSGSPAAEATLAQMPDLVIEQMFFLRSRTAPGWDLRVTVRNQGNAVATGFYVRSIKLDSSTDLWVPGLAAGASITHDFYIGTCGSMDEVSGFVYADWFEQVTEFNESNNSRSWRITESACQR